MKFSEHLEKEDKQTPEYFQNFLSLLSSDLEKAIWEYRNLQLGLENFFRIKGVKYFQDAAQMCLERLVLVLGNNDYEKIDDIYRFSYGVAKNVFMELIKAEQRELEVKAKLISENEEKIKYGFDEDILRTAQKQCLAKLPDDERELIIRYYSTAKSPAEQKENRRRLALEYKMDMSFLRIKIHRIRHKLEKCLFGDKK